jgi:hypothetical protein
MNIVQHIHLWRENISKYSNVTIKNMVAFQSTFQVNIQRYVCQVPTGNFWHFHSKPEQSVNF